MNRPLDYGLWWPAAKLCEQSMYLLDSISPPSLLLSLEQFSVLTAGAHLHWPGAKDPAGCANTPHCIEQGFSGEV